MNCEICGEEKPKEQFYQVMYFKKFRKSPVKWCRDCQKMYMKMKKDQEQSKELKLKEAVYLVSFDQNVIFTKTSSLLFSKKEEKKYLAITIQ